MPAGLTHLLMAALCWATSRCFELRPAEASGKAHLAAAGPVWENNAKARIAEPVCTCPSSSYHLSQPFKIHWLQLACKMKRKQGCIQWSNFKWTDLLKLYRAGVFLQLSCLGHLILMYKWMDLHQVAWGLFFIFRFHFLLLPFNDLGSSQNFTRVTIYLT